MDFFILYRFGELRRSSAFEGAAVTVLVLVAVATAPAAAVAAHLKVERRDMLFDGVPHGAVNLGE